MNSIELQCWESNPFIKLTVVVQLDGGQGDGGAKLKQESVFTCVALTVHSIPDVELILLASEVALWSKVIISQTTHATEGIVLRGRVRITPTLRWL